MSNEGIICINLTEERDAYIVKDRSGMIHLGEYDRIKDLISQSLQAAKNYADHKIKSDSSNDTKGSTKKRCHDTIMLAGVRGSGKTTFMLSILDHIDKGVMKISKDGLSECDIETLPIFDPTLIEDKTHIFANIVSMIKNKVDEKAKKANCFSDDKSESFRDFQGWEKSFRALSEGMPTIDGLGANGFSTDSWLDPQFVMDKGIRMAHAATTLEDSFHDFVHQSLKFLNKKAFILCFDDVDTSFGKGGPVLEVLHKYLTTPQMITVLSGDTNLYSTLIRERQWLSFSDKLLKQECRSNAEHQEFKETVAHLEEQYFLKLLKPQRRIFLNNLYHLNSFVPVKIQYEEKLAGEYLRPMYERLLMKLGTGRSDMADSYRFLATLPLRSQKQLLLAFIQLESPTTTDRRFIQDIFDVFWSDLTVKNVNVANLRNNPETIAIHTLNYLVGNDLLSEGYTLDQTFNDPLTNGVQFALGTVLHVQACNDPAHVFEYWVRVCMARELGIIMGSRQVLNGSGPSIRDFIDHCALTQSKSPRYLARFSTAYLRAYRAYNSPMRRLGFNTTNDERAWHGTLPLYGLAEKTKASLAERETRIDYVLFHPDAKTPPLLRIIGAIPLSGATDHSNRALPIYSIYNILGILGQVITTARRYGAEFDNAAQEVAALLYRDAQFREYPLPNWALSNGIEEIDETVESTSNQEQYDHFVSDFAGRLALWAHLFDGQTVSASLLGKIFTRLFYTLNNLDTQYREPLLGEWLHRMVVIFLNSAVIVEAMDHHKDLTGKQLQLTNPVTKDDILIDNLSKLNRDQPVDEITLPFSRWLLACPLWTFYLKHDEVNKSLSNQISQFIKPFVSAQVEQSVFIRWQKTNIDLSLNIFDEFNLVRLLNHHNVTVKGYERREEPMEVTSKPTSAEELFGKDYRPKLPESKNSFNFRYKKRLTKYFESEKLTVEDVKSMENSVLKALLNKSYLVYTFEFPGNIAEKIKGKLGNDLTW